MAFASEYVSNNTDELYRFVWLQCVVHIRNMGINWGASVRRAKHRLEQRIWGDRGKNTEGGWQWIRTNVLEWREETRREIYRERVRIAESTRELFRSQILRYRHDRIGIYQCIWERERGWWWRHFSAAESTEIMSAINSIESLCALHIVRVIHGNHNSTGDSSLQYTVTYAKAFGLQPFVVLLYHSNETG